MDLERAHDLARERGPNMIVYWIARAILQPAALIYFRLRRIGIGHIPADGPVLMAGNHRSFSDPFFMGMCIGRPLRFVAKVELFDRRWKAWLLLALGAFPIRRDESDEMAMETARLILEQGGAVGIFPEGTRVRPGPLGRPRRGVGRLALETGAPVVPVALIGTEDIRRGWRIRPRRVIVRCGRPLTFPRPLDGVSERMAAEVTTRIWTCVSLQWEWLGGVVPVRNAVVVGAGSWGTANAVLLARGGAAVQLACRSADQAEAIRAHRSNAHYLPGVAVPEQVEVTTIDGVDWRGVDAVCLAVPSHALPAALDSVADVLPGNAGVLLASKGLVGERAELPSRFATRRLGERPIAFLGGPAHALEAVNGVGASLVFAGTDRRFAARLATAFANPGVACSTSGDIVGVEYAGIAKNAAALAAGVALAAGANRAGAAAGQIYSECFAIARAEGARADSFAGMAGAGDLVATVLGSSSRNRRAGELLGEGVAPGQVTAMLGQTPEAIHMVPLLARAAERAGVRAPAVRRLAGLVEGRVAPERWLARAA